MKITIPDAIRQMLEIVKRLRETYPKRKFTLDGRLVGDLGEILVEGVYDVKLFDDQKKHHDGTTSDGRYVQVKATMKDSLTFPVDHTPDFYLGIMIDQNGTFTEVFNGPGWIAQEAVKGRKPPKNNQYSIAVAVLKKLNEKVKKSEQIPRREIVLP
jgi:hypothetical protein